MYIASFIITPLPLAVVNIFLTLTPQVSEGGVATATLTVPQGQLGREVRVRLSSINGNATGGIDFERVSNVEIVLSGENPSQSLSIQTFDNAMFDGNRVFSVVAELLTIGQIGINPSVVMATIIDDEVAPQGTCTCIFTMYMYIIT